MKNSNNNAKEQTKLNNALALELKKQEKETISNSKVSNILNADLDNKALMTELQKITLPSKQINTNKGMFKFDTLIENYNTISKEEVKKQTKVIRRKARNKRNSLLLSICKEFKDNNTKQVKELVKDFNTFYKEYYLLNDYSINSIARSSSDKDNIVFISLGLQIVKNSK